MYHFYTYLFQIKINNTYLHALGTTEMCLWSRRISTMKTNKVKVWIEERLYDKWWETRMGMERENRFESNLACSGNTYPKNSVIGPFWMKTWVGVGRVEGEGESFGNKNWVLKQAFFSNPKTSHFSFSKITRNNLEIGVCLFVTTQKL